MADGKRPIGKGIPDQNELLRPLIFPNHQRGFKLFNAAIATGLTVYFVFIHKFSSEDHCFMPIRRFVEQQKRYFFQIKPEDEEYIRKRTEELKAKQAERTS
ncbi:uncharacterized protein LOC116604387 [Nematostella vectensis]|uniref:uncharacterized protein LOC116604387 n=1 Tax=Nematostella vectensis TaxID=45351 RepID=UPI00138FB4AF|nr:uncharacterized protein LOC116604387 [Nematostella vectensis]